MSKHLLIPLEFIPAKKYFIEKIQDGNILSQKILKNILFEQGEFFSFLNQEADPSKIYQFNAGGILPQNPLKKIDFQGKEYNARRRNDSVQELLNYMDHECKKNKDMSVIFEDVTREKKDPNSSELDAHTIYHKNEVFYYINGDKYTQDTACQLIQATDALWYYLNVFTSEKINFNTNNMTEENLKEIVSKITHIFLGAYDMEGYICWKKLTTNAK